MKSDQSLPILAVPSGGHFLRVEVALSKCGITMAWAPRSYWTQVPGFLVVRLRVKDMPSLLASGNLDVGFCGLDTVREAELGGAIEAGALEPLLTLGHPDRGDLRSEWILASSSGQGDLQSASPDGVPVIATEIPNIVREWCGRERIDASVLQTSGSTEAYCPHFADAVVDVAFTGASLQAAGLSPIRTVFVSEFSLWMLRGRGEDSSIQDLVKSLLPIAST